MKNQILITLQIIILLSASIAPAQTKRPTIINKEVSLNSDGKVVTFIELENTHSRSYQGIINRCALSEKNEGVIWRIVCVGAKFSGKEISIRNERDQLFEPVCWSSTSEYSKKSDKSDNIIYEGPTTELLFAGDDDSKKIVIAIGTASVEIKIE